MRTIVYAAVLAASILTGLWTAGDARASQRPAGPRRVVKLDGTWQVAEGTIDRMPGNFDRTVPVPGLIDMAQPAFRDVGRRSPLRQAFWYRRTFRVEGPAPEVALVKVHKACYGTKVWLNGTVLGEHAPCFTPGWFDARKALRSDGRDNELVIRVGADRESIPTDTPSGWDFEKYLYTPGVYDSVELILTGGPVVKNVQIVPDIAAKTARVVVEIEAGPAAGEAKLTASVCEARSGKAVGLTDAAAIALAAGQTGTTELFVALPDCRLWSPEDPFLYEMTVSSGGDAVKVRFGMRSFRFDVDTKRALLNGKPYYLRGTNICAFRFFEDAQRGDKPWRDEWVRRLHRRFKTMHWNSIRYCIGFPPEIWYDIADEEGFLIQDEFPIWLLSPNSKTDAPPEFPKAQKIIPEYVEWMRERWNHPCVVIWDGQNESFTDETGKAIRAVRRLDLSNRPWENGWSEPQSPTDCVESHPYLYIRTWMKQPPFRLSEMPTVSPTPGLNDRQKKLNVPIVVNEYCWLWLNRDGTPTCLTDKVYESLLGPQSTTAQRREVHARHVAALTEFWRCHRRCAGVLHFCGLGYSRSGDKPRPEGGATSDHFLDLEKLNFEPRIAEYVGEAFSPVGLMLDFWAEKVTAGTRQSIKVYAINDLQTLWSGAIRVQVRKDGLAIFVSSQEATITPAGRTIVPFIVAMPRESGKYTIQAELVRGKDKPVRSLRDFEVP